MENTRDALVATGFRVAQRVNDSYVPFLAGSLAYHVFLLLTPLLLLLLVVISAVGGDAAVAYLAEFGRPYITPQGRALFASAVRSGSQHMSVVVVGVAAIAWSALRIFRGLDVVFARVYDTDTHESVRGQVRDGLVGVATVTLALAAAAASGAVASLFPWESLVRLLNLVVLVAVLGGLFFPLYYVIPNVEMTAREALPGTGVAVGGWLIFHVLFQLYAEYALTLEAYGVLGTVLSVLVWLYSSMFILLLGGVVNAVLAERSEDDVAPAERG